MMLTGGIFVWLLCLFCAVFESDIYAADKRLVKVAFFPMDGYHITNPDGSYGGMDVEYLNALCDYADWEIEYVDCDSWEEALALLSDKQVDLVGSAQYSNERAEIYQYADLSSGYTFGVIATNPESTIAYEDFTAMQHITFGMVENYVRRDEFLQYLRDNGIENPVITEYASTADLQEALSAGEIDAFVHTFTEVREGQRLIGRFAPRPFYYITYKGNDDVMRELNQAASDLKMNRPELETELVNEFYYSRFVKPPVSGCSETGLELEYRRMESRKEAQTMLRDGEIDILAYCTETEEVLEEYQLAAVCDYAEVPLVLVTAKNRNINEIETLVTVPFLLDEAGEAVQTGATEIVTYEKQQECIDAVKEEEADAVLCDGYLAEYLMRTEFRYESLQIKNVLNSGHTISMAVREEDELLSGILEKTLSEIDSKRINAYMLRENTYPLISVIVFVRNNSLWIISILVAVMIVIILLAVHMVNDSRKIQKLMYKDTKMDIWNMNYLIFWGEHKLLPEHKAQYALAYVISRSSAAITLSMAGTRGNACWKRSRGFW